jgi:hypothetical protein
MYLKLINLVTPKARAKHEPFVQQTSLSFCLFYFIILFFWFKRVMDRGTEKESIN